MQVVISAGMGNVHLDKSKDTRLILKVQTGEDKASVILDIDSIDELIHALEVLR